MNPLRHQKLEYGTFQKYFDRRILILYIVNVALWLFFRFFHFQIMILNIYVFDLV